MTILTKTILLVEDDLDLIGVYKEVLEMNGYDVITAINGKEGLEKYMENYPSLVLMDGDMPIMDGYEAFKKIKEFDKNANVIIITGYSEFEETSQAAIKEGLIKIIAKPIGIDKLLDIVKKYIEIKLEK